MKAGIVLGLGLITNLVLFIMSRLSTVPISFYYMENGKKMVQWSGDRVGHSFRYFLEFHDIELLAVLVVVAMAVFSFWAPENYEKHMNSSGAVDTQSSVITTDGQE